MLVFPVFLHFGGFQASEVFFWKSGGQTVFDKTFFQQNAFFDEQSSNLRSVSQELERKPLVFHVTNHGRTY